MERVIEVSIFSLPLTQPSTLYVSSCIEYAVEANILSRDIGVLWDTYVLKLRGTDKNIQSYLEHLQDIGFKIRMAKTKK